MVEPELALQIRHNGLQTGLISPPDKPCLGDDGETASARSRDLSHKIKNQIKSQIIRRLPDAVAAALVGGLLLLLRVQERRLLGGVQPE